MITKNILKSIAYWTLPLGLYEIVKGYRLDALRYHAGHRRDFRKNAALLDIHAGKRCFIIGNGPSVKQQDLLLLKDELVFSVSNGYHHKDYATICPRYHCIPQLTFTDIFTKELAIAWFQEMNSKLMDPDIFLNYTERNLVESNGLLKDRRLHYVCFGRRFNEFEMKRTDISRVIPTPQSVPVMCIMIALYMGFSQIYLIGVEHDTFMTGEYKYFYNPTILKGKDHGVTPDGKVKDSLYDQFQVLRTLWFQYLMLKNIADSNGVCIYNATAGGALDVFPRVRYEDLFVARNT